MIDQLSDLERLLSNRSGNTPYATIRTEGGALKSFSFLELIQHLDEKMIKSSEQTVAPKVTQRLGTLPSPHGDVIQRLLEQSFLASKQTSPIVAVAGILNAGKSSLVASFLSSAGQNRLLIGSSNAQGTHRFVLWLPESWRMDALLWENTLSQIESIFGYPPEELSTSREIAFGQYNGHYCSSYLDANPAASEIPAILIPLVATDLFLDSHGIGLMDCPDIQTGFFDSELNSAEGSLSGMEGGYRDEVLHDLRTDTKQSIFSEQRRSALAKSLQISSAFIVVLGANSIQDETVSEILGTVQRVMPGLRTILAINRIPRSYDSLQIAEEIRNGYRESGLWRVYMAYHFEGPLLRHRIPVLPSAISSLPTSKSSVASETLPVFFRIDTTSIAQPPSEIDANDYLVRIGGQLDPSQLSRERLDATLISLKAKIHQGILSIDSHNQQRLNRRDCWYELLSRSILSISTQDKARNSGIDTIRLQVSRELIQQISVSLEKTAPWWAMPGRLAIRWSSRVQQVASNATSWFQIPTWLTNLASGATEFVTSRWRTGDGGRIISPRDFLETLIAHDLSYRLLAGLSIDDRKLWEERLQNVLVRFQSESRVRLSDEQLDAFTCEMWKRMTWKQCLWNGVAPAGLLFAPIVAALMLPFDPVGGTTVLLAATGKELLLAGLVSVGLSMINADTMPKMAEEETAWKQLSELFAVSCDELGLERPHVDKLPKLVIRKVERSLLTSTLSVQTKQPINLADELFVVEQATAKRLRQLL